MESKFELYKAETDSHVSLPLSLDRNLQAQGTSQTLVDFLSVCKAVVETSKTDDPIDEFDSELPVISKSFVVAFCNRQVLIEK